MSALPTVAAPPALAARRRTLGFACVALAGAALPWLAVARTQPRDDGACPALLRHSFDRLQDDKPQALCEYAGKVLLVVNTASLCGFTPQFEGLEALHAKYASRGLVVLGFPSGDFGGQEHDDSRRIGEVCFNTWGVRFPMFAKSSVTGPRANPLHAALAKATGQAPKWNFHKYLVDRQGRPLASFPSDVTPADPKLVAAIETALAQPAPR